MTNKSAHRVLFAVAGVFAALAPLAALVLSPDSVTGTAGLMANLPAYDKFRCVICHSTSAPTTGSSDLNDFGTDFRSNGSVWDQTLALLNSDGDRCLNGFELGDEDGDGSLDYPAQSAERSNPGDGSDCSIAMTIQTWGRIKEIFRSEMPPYFDDDLPSDSLFYGSEDRFHLP